MTMFGNPAYGMTKALSGVRYEDAVESVKGALSEAGFGVLTEIDIRSTLKKKLDVEHRPYVILGACNPKLAHRALSEEPPIGLLLPCNVVVAETDDGAVVSMLDPQEMFKVTGRNDIEPLAREVKGLLQKALDAI